MGQRLRRGRQRAAVVQTPDTLATGTVLEADLGIRLGRGDHRHRVVGGPGQALVGAGAVEGADQVAVGVVTTAKRTLTLHG